MQRNKLKNASKYWVKKMQIKKACRFEIKREKYKQNVDASFSFYKKDTQKISFGFLKMVEKHF